MPSQPPANVSESPLSCLEVWGGNGTGENYLARPGLDVWIRSQTQGCSDAGGSDLHLLSSCASGRITRILLADVCSYGSLFTEVAAELGGLMKRHINSVRQARLIDEISQRLAKRSQRGAYVTTMISTYFASTRSLSLCNMGHPPPLLYRAKEKSWSYFKQVPAGAATCCRSEGIGSEGFVASSEYQQVKTQLELGDMFLSYSNVLTECRSAEGRTIGLPGLLERVEQCFGQQPAQLPQQLLTHLQHEHPENATMQDATVILCRATDNAIPWRDNLLAPWRLLKSVTDKTEIV